MDESKFNNHFAALDISTVAMSSKPFPTLDVTKQSLNPASVPSFESNKQKADGISVQDICQEFTYLLERSHQLFAGLRELPPIGSQKSWQPYFQRTFEVYTKLWKFQQTHRVVLEKDERVGLKRWQIGEMASKIAQLYYHYYLRTSETNYLQEAFVFYQAIHDRQYFKDVLEAKNAGLMVKKLRYIARFVVICLLLNKTSLVYDLMHELESCAQEYVTTFDPADATEWKSVVTELTSFLKAGEESSTRDEQDVLLPINTRLQSERVKMERDGTPRLRLTEVILVGNVADQPRFSELTMDMYRMLQSLEREPQGPGRKDTSKQGSMEDLEARKGNPHKYLLYKPSFSQLMLHVSACFKELSDTSCMLLYLSADASPCEGGDLGKGGVLLNVKKSDKPDQDRIATLFPGDLISYTRKPLFMIVESPSSSTYENLPRYFNQPLAILMSPTFIPRHIPCNSILTTFLHSPLKAFCQISNISKTTREIWNQLGTLFSHLEREVLERLVSIPLDIHWKRFIQDDFLRVFIARFIIAHSLLSLHKDFNQLPTSNPPLPLNQFQLIPRLQNIIDLANVASIYPKLQ